MWAFIFLYVLGLNVYQATGQGMSTQMYYTTLIVDETAIENVTTWLTLVKDNEKQVDDLRMTTINMRGTITLKDDYLSCLADTQSEEYNQCNNKLLQQMKAVFSTLRGFDTLSITKYSFGSIIADFVITIAYGVDPQDLINKTLILTGNLSATVYLRTTGLIILKMPENPVPYSSSSTVTCTAQDLDIQPIWQLKRAGITYDITNGTESEVIFQAKGSKVNLKNITELWAGEYTCLYKQTSQSYSINHIASDLMSVAFLPNIDITTFPAFPLCKNKTGVQIVIVRCEVASSSETYIVKWEKINITTSITPRPPQSKLIFLSSSSLPSTLKESFLNFSSSNYADGKYCAAEDVWENTKAGFTAVIKCTNAAGRRQRQCTTKPQWENEISGCVDKTLNSVLEKAKNVDIGLGLLEGNSAQVFSELKNITQKTEVINTFPNLKTSVVILNSMKQKLNQINNISTVNGLFIFLTTCLGDKLTRDALLHRLKMKTLSSINDNSTKTDSTVKK
ncbi:hypothetical protein L3Q82_026368 [Scortum barcoo]|uniref:Uncharacterized protein n=1 Tax=Scortum barcoo TaxID=214431 RepID=A0ACB8WIE6_9TELE|nr:hypothetical protein L3Q82_026368 [Scortum barcoo]